MNFKKLQECLFSSPQRFSDKYDPKIRLTVSVFIIFDRNFVFFRQNISSCLMKFIVDINRIVFLYREVSFFIYLTFSIYRNNNINITAVPTLHIVKLEIRDIRMESFFRSCKT